MRKRHVKKIKKEEILQKSEEKEEKIDNNIEKSPKHFSIDIQDGFLGTTSEIGGKNG